MKPDQKWCQPLNNGVEEPRKFIVMFDDADRGLATFDDEGEARKFFEQCDVAWNCYLFGVMPVEPNTRAPSQKGREDD